MNSRDLLKLKFGVYRQFSLRFYPGTPVFNKYSWGFRPLSFPYKGIPNRFALDFGGMSLIFENYNYR